MYSFAVKDFKCFIPCDKSLPEFNTFGFSINLFELETGATPNWPSYTWNFTSINKRPECVEINLSRLNAHSVRIKTSGRTHIADRFTRVKNSGFAERMFLSIISNFPGAPLNPVFVCELHISPQEVYRIKERVGIVLTSPIEWFFVELTNQCNFKCKWCPQEKMTRGHGYMSFINAKLLMDKIAEYKRKNPIFSLYAEIKNPVFLHVMGEPLLHPRFFDIIDYGQKQGLDFCLVTNGSLLSEKVIHKILDSGIKFIVISLNAPDPETFIQTGSKFSYEKLLNRIGKLLNQRYKRRLNWPRIEIQLLNTKTLEFKIFSAVEKTKQVEQALIFWSDFIRDLEVRWEMHSDPPPNEQEVKWETALDERGLTPGVYFNIGKNIFLVFKHAINFGGALLPKDFSIALTQSGRCPFRNANRCLCVLWDGSCTFCPLDYDNSVQLENIFDNEIETIWMGPRMNRIRGLMENDVLIEPLCRLCQGAIIRKSSYKGALKK